MKNKLLLLTIASLLTVACNESKNTTIQSTNVQIKGIEIETYIFDSCEYVGSIIENAHNQDWMTHKGNCRFCKYRNSK
jgi:hypothetical protein